MGATGGAAICAAAKLGCVPAVGGLAGTQAHLGHFSFRDSHKNEAAKVRALDDPAHPTRVWESRPEAVVQAADAVQDSASSRSNRSADEREGRGQCLL